MATDIVSTTDNIVERKVRKKPSRWYKRWWLWLLIGLLLVGVSTVTFKIVTAAPAPAEPPEMAKIMAAQDSMHEFGILIPGYLPRGFDRAKVEIETNQNGPGGEPTADLTYRTKTGATIFIHQWVPVHPELEILNGSRIIQTKWGKGWLLTQGTDGLVDLWVDIGPLRVSVITTDPKTVSREQLLLVGETLGLASNNQAFTFAPELPRIQDIQPPPPFEVQLNDEGIQELNLTITPGGFEPIRFEVEKGIPVKINFRALGEVGCGNVVMIPTQGVNYAALEVTKTKLVDSVTFTPDEAGQFKFFCTSDHYRGIMFVREGSQP
jgi:hypothetical protein